MNNKRIIKNIGISMIMKPISMLLTFIYTPMFLAYLGDEKYGVWAIVMNVVSWINYFDIGIGNGLRNKLAEAVAKGDEKSAQKFVSTAFAGTTIISLVFCVLIISVWMTFDLSSVFNLDVSGVNADAVIAISISFVCINFVLSLFKTSAYAIQQPGIISVFSVIGQVVQIIVILIIPAIAHESIIAVAIMYGLVSLFDNILLGFFITKNRKYLTPKKSCVDLTYFKPLISLGLGFFVMEICGLVLNTTDNLLISNLFGASEVTPYSMAYKVFYLFVQIHGIIIMPMWSAYTEAVTNGNLNWLKRTMKKVDRITLLMSLGVLIGVVLFKPFASVWLGKELDYGNTLIPIIAAYMIAQMFSNNYSSFLCGTGYIKIPTIISAIGAVLNIPVSVLFAKTLGMGLSGIILGSFAVMLMSVIANPIVTKYWFSKNEKTESTKLKNGSIEI